jgi:predicted component of type VI protein secretion system
VAKLLIFRGETQLDERQLAGQTVRIGRAPQNDLVLEDPGKGVSRNHAEIRFEGGRYTLVDLGSQNGIWVSGNRVPSVVLEPGLSAALGPYRLMVEAPAVPTPAVATAPVSGIGTATDLTQISERSPAPLDLDSLGSPSKKQEAPPVEKRPAPAPARPAAVAKEPGRTERTLKQTTVSKEPGLNAKLIGVVVALVLIAVSAFMAYRVMRKPSLPPWDASAAQALVSGGKCQEALEKEIGPALQKDPNNQQAIALRDRCNQTAQVTSSVTSTVTPSPPTADERLNQAEPLLQANVVADCQTALDAINAVLAEDPNNQRGKDLAVKANACINPPPVPHSPVAPTEKPAVQVPPSQGGLEMIQGETDKLYKNRMAAARKKYDDAVALLTAQKYAQAGVLLTELANEVPNGYLDLQQRREEVRTAMRTEGKAELEAAQAADARDNFDSAIDHYRRAHNSDPTIIVEAAIQAITARKTELGKKRCAAGNVAKIYGDTAVATAAFAEAAKLLQGTNDPCLATAREYLQKVK